MKTILLLASTLMFALNDICAQNTWTQKTNFGGNTRSGAVGFSIGDKGYLGTGRANLGSAVAMNDFWEYDPSNNTWTQKANFGGTARYLATGFSIGSKGYIGIGYDGSYKNDFWEYDPATNAWAPKANFGGTARSTAVGFSIGDKGYIGTGYDGSSKNDFWEYDPNSNTWSQKSSFAGSARYGATGLSIGNKGYIGNGYDGNLKNDFWEYDPILNSWTQKANYGGGPRILSCGFNIGNKGYVGIGETILNDYNTLSTDFWEYDPADNTWTQKANYGAGPSDAAAGFSIGNKGYIGTGLQNGASSKNDFWEYTPDSDGDGYDPDQDCDDDDPDIHPGVKEICDGLDNDCDELIDENTPKAKITPLGDLDICALGSVVLRANKGIGLKYQWLKGKNNIAGATNRTYTANSIGFYKVIVTDTIAGCSNTSKKVIVTKSCLTNSTDESQARNNSGNLSLYPNPVKDILHLDNLKGNATISILTQDGRMVDKKIVSNNTHAWNVKNLAAGTYYMRIEEETKVSILKFIKQ